MRLRLRVAGYSAGMPVRFIFRCQFCDAQPDPLTQINLEKAMRENTWGAYQNALPENWLVFHGARAVRLGALRLRGAPRRSRGPPARALRHDWVSRLEAPAVPVEPRSFRYRPRLDRCNAPTRKRWRHDAHSRGSRQPRGPASRGGPADRSARGSIRESGMGRCGRVGKRAGRSGLRKPCRNPLLVPFRCRFPLRLPIRLPIRGPQAGSNRQSR